MTEKEEKKSLVQLAKDRFAAAQEAYGPLRKLAEQDMKFMLGDSDNLWQWPDETAQDRANKNKVVLTVNVAAQHANQITNQIRQNRPAVKVSPVDDGADKETAEILAGLVRNIQSYSNADDAHDLAAEYAIGGGEGYWRIITEYEDSRTVDKQVPVIKPVLRPDLVYIDPNAQELDKSDAKWAFIFEDLSKEEAKAQFPGVDVDSWESEPDGWVSDKQVRIAEYFHCEEVESKLYLLEDGSVVEELQEGQKFLKDRVLTKKKWKWCKLIGKHGKPVDEREWVGSYLPIISVVGKELYAGKELVRKGVIRDLKDQNRMINYAYSETVQTIALQNNAPYMAAVEATEGLEEIWDNSNLENFGSLPFNAFDKNGNALPQPSRQTPPVMPMAQVQLLQLSTEQMRAASGQQNTNFGIKSEASSGIGIQRLKTQGEVATFHFPDNLTRALRYECRVLIDLIQKLYDVPRVVRVLGLDGKEELAKLDPTAQQAYIEDKGAQISKIFNPTLGRYDVTIDTGPSFQTLRQEGAAQLNAIAARNPAMMEVAGDLVFKAQDFPFADELAERFEKVLPPHLRDNEEQQPIPPQVQQQFQQMQQMIQQLGAENEGLKREEAVKKYEIDKKYSVEMYKAETERFKPETPDQMMPTTAEADLR